MSPNRRTKPADPEGDCGASVWQIKCVYQPGVPRTAGFAVIVVEALTTSERTLSTDYVETYECPLLEPYRQP